MADDLLHTQLRHIRFLLFVLVGFVAFEVLGPPGALLTLLVVVLFLSVDGVEM
ncbi:hypothetical protein [Halorussus halophilus]|uniref:hypothetical protein n=1 Tax=Halorussus halophilus TaxID=2650975 RepID=UPI001787EBE4|nr:hypothetical protein [Halorussus halophilus]